MTGHSPIRSSRLGATACALVLCGAALAGPSAVSWPDVEGRIQYGYFTEDRRALAAIGELLAADPSSDKLKSYYAGLLAYKLTLLALQAKDTPQVAERAAARQSAGRCNSELERALRLQKDFPEALALRAACLELLTELDGWRAPLAGVRSGSQIERARELAPRNPRVLFLDVAERLPRARGDKAERARLRGELRAAIAAFERERAEERHVPSWGAAEAYLILARSCLEEGDAAAARDALEHALLLAPEYAEARRMMKRIVS